MFSYDELSSKVSSSCNVETLQSVGDADGSVNLIVQSYQVGLLHCDVEERYAREEDEDDAKMVYALRP